MEPTASVPEAFLASVARSQLKGIVTPLADSTCLGTRPGPTRASVEGNQDRVLCARLTDSFGDQADAFVICDGIGGMVDGGRCAEIAIAAFLLALAARLSVGYDGPLGALQGAVEVANRRLFLQYSGRGGTTLACVLSCRGKVFACSVGDTRIFGIDASGPKQISVDDTMRSALEAAGHEDLESGPEHDKLIQFVGMGPELRPHILQIDGRDRLRHVLVCTDGAYRLPAETFARLTARAQTPKQLVERLIHVSDWLGGVDDASVIAVSWRSLDAKERGSHAPVSPDRTTIILCVWGVGQIGQPATLLFNRHDLSRRVHDLDDPARPRAAASQPVAPQADRPKNRRGKSRQKRDVDAKQPMLLPTLRNDAKGYDDVIIEAVAPSDRSVDPHDTHYGPDEAREEEPATDPDHLRDDERRRRSIDR